MYSNVKYVEEGGDLVGAELTLIPSAAGDMGIFTSYENDRLPYAVGNIVRTKDAIRFTVRTQNGEESYQGELSPQKITLRRNDAEADPEQKPMVLVKTKGVADILTKAGIPKRSEKTSDQ